jgi:hypothetical protein
VDYSRINLTRKKLYDTGLFKRVDIEVGTQTKRLRDETFILTRMLPGVWAMALPLPIAFKPATGSWE